MQQAPTVARWLLMPSTVVRRFVYVRETRELTIEFVTGRRYRYFDVPSEAVDEFRSAFSKGGHFNRHIRDNYRFQELARAADG